MLDRWNKAHELDNLFVVDTSFFWSAASVNPTLTTVANAMRVGDHIRSLMGVAAAEPPKSPSAPRRARKQKQEGLA